MAYDKEALADAVEAMWDACQQKDWTAAAQAFADAQMLSDDDSSEEEEGDEKKTTGKRPPLAALLLEKKD